MKKIFLLAASAMMILAGCNKVENVYEGEAQEIAFFSVNKVATKTAGGISTAIFPTDFPMQVSSYLVAGDGVATASLYFDETKFSNVSNTNTWTGGKYWPVSGATLNFFAVAPELNGVATTFNADQSTTTVTSNQSNQYDIMYAVGQGSKTAGTTPGNVTMAFKHALSWINFEFLTTTGNGMPTITINSVTLNGVKYNGTLTVTNNNYNTTTMPVATAQWTTPGDDVSAIVVPETNNPNIPLELNGTATVFGDGLLILPGTGNANSNFVINYTMQVGGDAAQNFTYTYSLEGQTWAMNSKYTYKITISPQQIVVAPTVDIWTEKDPTETTIK